MTKIENAEKELQSKYDDVYSRLDSVMALINDVGLENIKRTENIRSILENERNFKILSVSQINQAFTQGISNLRQCHNKLTSDHFVPGYIGWLWTWFYVVIIFFVSSVLLNIHQFNEVEKISKEMAKHKRFGRNVMEYMRDNMEDTRKLRKYMEEEGWNLIFENNPSPPSQK